MDLGVAGKVFIVTGGSSGLGFATARTLVEDGARVVIAGRDEARLDAAVHELGDAAVGAVADLAEPGAEELLLAVAHDSFGQLDGALISVGGPAAGTLMDSSEDDWRNAFESVFMGGLRVARAVAGQLGEGGSIAFVLSSSVKSPIGGLAISNGLRPGLAMAAKTMADELGPRGIRVNALMPGRIATDRVAELDARGGDPEGARRAAEATIPLGRYGRPEEFGRAAAFLLSPAASYLSGIALPVDGGMLRAL